MDGSLNGAAPPLWSAKVVPARSSKAAVLERLALDGQAFVVDPFVRFTIEEWHTNESRILRLITDARLGNWVVVRSSAVSEDTDPSLGPGSLRSCLDVDAHDSGQVRRAIESVALSYLTHPSAAQFGGRNEVIVQRQLRSARLSGVATSRDPRSGGPYHLVEYDDVTLRTDAVTGGRACKRVHVLRDADRLPQPWEGVVAAVREAETILSSENLIVEFAIAESGEVHVFQARTSVWPNSNTMSDTAVHRLLDEARSAVAGMAHTVWSDMADWNPAELLGDQPAPLDFSLYRCLLSDYTWAAARAQLGYHQPHPAPLVRLIGGKPYVDVRKSFESLTPARLDPDLRRRIVDDRLRLLRTRPDLHDKIEFEVMFTCADVATPRRTLELEAAGVTRAEREHLDYLLGALTREALLGGIRSPASGARRAFPSSGVDTRPRQPWGELDDVVIARRVRAMLAQCRTSDALVFALHARRAFIGRDLLDRLATAGAVDREWVESFWQSVRTVASGVVGAMHDVVSGRRTPESFHAMFGHLRPKMFDITAPRYDQTLSLPSAMPAIAEGISVVAPLSAVTTRRIGRLLTNAGIGGSANRFLDAAADATRQRETWKFNLSRVVSECLEGLAEIGSRLELTRGDLAFLPISELLAESGFGLGRPERRARWKSAIAQARATHTVAQSLRLPDVITTSGDLVVVRPVESRPTFVTSGVAEGPVILLPRDPADIPPTTVLKGGIVAIVAADPGYDWVFAHGIAGIITRFGGALSHMAVRASEFGLPAAIGCGVELFEPLSSAQRIRLDCGKREITIVNEV